ncbi:hypothetical protein Sphch_3432 [Sphingobium chlorophenolicum L-1]|uniref:Lipoprotein n=1 Tax=Sphingobium chlorophenolicum L-1 TaxID=690566 RepID=F6F3L3_SPHCR|nr:hypothetical protein [Sphingobium chlorophenolicum]AEG51025.1 hypothetical protein Sphch_3432 [Sphingobium chlorophenolicum L-1]
MQRPASPPGPISIASILFASIVLLAACSPAARNENGRVPGGTDQQEAINAAGNGGGADAMPGVGAPGTGGNGTQP